VEITFKTLLETATCETIYRRVTTVLLSRGILLSREQFLTQNYTMVVSVDGLMALAKSAQPLTFIMAEAPPFNGRRPPR